jgi:hypothetical protein
VRKCTNQSLSEVNLFMKKAHPYHLKVLPIAAIYVYGSWPPLVMKCKNKVSLINLHEKRL